LLAEDNLVNQRLASRLLEKQGHTVTLASSGKEVLKILGVKGQESGSQESVAFDVILMDVQMPDMGGFEATGLIRQHEEEMGRHTPIIAMTAHALKGDRERCLMAGMDDYVSKPIRSEELYAAVARATARMQSPSDLPEDADQAEMLRQVAGDVKLFREMVQLFLDTCPGMIDSLRQAVQAGKPTEVKLMAHSIKGAVRYFGGRAGLAHDAAQRLETMGNQGNLEQGHEALAALEEALQRLRPALVALLQEEQAS
jgi:CheY-like chemotaxis protein/HPt (histidine-containing phosphotransfer) domain-containing protein